MVNTKLGPLGVNPEKLYALYLKNWALDTRSKKTRTSLNDKLKPAYSGKPNQVSAVAKNLG
jgi:hypothetical protein